MVEIEEEEEDCRDREDLERGEEGGEDPESSVLEEQVQGGLEEVVDSESSTQAEEAVLSRDLCLVGSRRRPRCQYEVGRWFCSLSL